MLNYDFIIKHLSQYHVIYSLISTLVVAIATIGYVIIAFNMVKTNVQTKFQPNVIANLGIHANTLFFSIKNTVSGTAENIDMQIDPPLLLQDKAIKNIHITSLVPEQEFRDYLEIPAEYDYTQFVKSDFVLTVTFYDQFKNLFSSTRIFDKRLFDNEPEIFKNPYQGIEEQLKLINNTLLQLLNSKD